MARARGSFFYSTPSPVNAPHNMAFYNVTFLYRLLFAIHETLVCLYVFVVGLFRA